MTPDRPTTAAGRALHESQHPVGRGKFHRKADEPCALLEAILAIEAEARQPDSEALRELADAIEAWAAGEGKFPGHRLDNALKQARSYLAALPPSAPPTPAYDTCTHAEGCICIEAAHASCCGVLREQTLAGLSAPPALDVERLAEALMAADGVQGFGGPHAAKAWAERIAAEYARLASQPGETT